MSRAVPDSLKALHSLTTDALIAAIKGAKEGRADARIIAAAVRHLANNSVSADAVQDADRNLTALARVTASRLPFDAEGKPAA